MLALGDREANELYGFALELAKHACVGSVGIGRPQESPLAWDRRMVELDPSDRAKIAVLLDVMSPGGALREASRVPVSMVKTAWLEKLPLFGRLFAKAAPAVAGTVAKAAPRAMPAWMTKTWQHYAEQPSWAKALMLGGAGYEGYRAQQGEISPLHALFQAGLGFAPIRGRYIFGGSLGAEFLGPKLQQELGIWTPPAEREARGAEQGYQVAQQDYQQMMQQQQAQLRQQLQQQQQVQQQQAQQYQPSLADLGSIGAIQNLAMTGSLGDYGYFGG